MQFFDIKSIFKKDFVVGLDIGADTIKMVQFSKKEVGLCLRKAECQEIGLIDGEEGRDQKIIDILKEFLNDIDLSKTDIDISINSQETAIKRVIVPYMPKSEMKEGISLAAKNYFPFSVEEAQLDFEILGDIIVNDVREYEVLVATTPRTVIDKCDDILDKAGIKPSSISILPCSYALQKFVGVSRSANEKTNCIIDIGENYTELIIVEEETLMFSRKIPFSGSEITRSMTDALVSERGKIQLSIQDAEKIKLEIGIPAEGEDRIIHDKISTLQILSMLRMPLENLASEIERCFEYYREETDGPKVEKIKLFGGGAGLKGLGKFLSDRLGIDVQIGDALEGLKVEEGKEIPERGRISHRLAAAVGVASGRGHGINLLPVEIKEKTLRTFEYATIHVVAVAVLLFLTLMYVGMKIQLGNYKKRISVSALELASLSPQLEEVKKYHLANTILLEEPHWEDIFKELSNITPEDIYLTNINMDSGVLEMKGIVSSEDGEQKLSAFILALEKGIFKSVKLVETKDLVDQLGNEFQIECHVE